MSEKFSLPQEYRSGLAVSAGQQRVIEDILKGTLENIPANGPFILAVNHQSFLDPLFAGIALKRVLCFMARDTLFKSRIFGPLLLSVNAIPSGESS